MPDPLSLISKEDLRAIRVVMTDIDDTLTLEGRLPAIAYAALERLHEAGFIVVPITGRPAGWCDLIARQWPVDAVVGENGAFYFCHDQSRKFMVRHYAQAEAERAANKAKLFAIAADVLGIFPGTAFATDQTYREVDVAIDFCEDVPRLPLQTAQDIASFFENRGATAKVSSIHVNAWIGTHDKLTMSLALLQQRFGISAKATRTQVAYCGDSPNDAPMFGFFDLSFGVANVAPFLGAMGHEPRYITQSQGGHGFSEIAASLLNR